MKIQLLLCLLTAALGLIQAQTYVSEPIRSHQTWTRQQSPYIISNDLFVAPNTILTIEAGTRVLFSSEVKMHIEGQIIAQGTAKKKIIFEGLNGNHWQGLFFRRAIVDNDEAIFTDTAMNVFEHTTFKGKDWNPIHLIQAENRNIKLYNCEIIDCQTAIQTEKQARIIAKNTHIQKCYRPLHVRITSQLTFLDSKISDYTLLLIGGSITFNNNIVKNALSRGSHSGLMIWMTGGGVATIENNTFINANNAAFTLYKTTKRNTIVLKNNIFKNNKTHLALSCEFAKRCKFIVQNNDFYEFESCPIELFDNCQAAKDTIMLDSNYFHKLTVDEVQHKLLKVPEAIADLQHYSTQIRVKGLLSRKNKPTLRRD